MRVWEVLAESYRQRLGAVTVTDIMRSSDLSRAEIMFGLRELAAGGWVYRVILERDRLTAEGWHVADWQEQQRRSASGPRRLQMAAE
jgi:hypothetical protein